MTTWSNDDIERIDAVEELDIASLRADGTLSKPVTIWVVRVGDDLYVRSYRANKGKWYRGTQERHAGRIWAGGVEKDVSYVDITDAGINDQIDAAYSRKYAHYPSITPSMLVPDVRATTLKLVPRST